jgi:hypothetical protein
MRKLWIDGKYTITVIHVMEATDWNARMEPQ